VVLLLQGSLFALDKTNLDAVNGLQTTLAAALQQSNKGMNRKKNTTHQVPAISLMGR
jgi:hypothetical protein